MSTASARFPARLLATCAIAAATLLGCGGVGTGGTGAFVSSSISGFASVIAGGVEFDDTHAIVVDDDGAPVTRTGDELRLGMTVGMDGSALQDTPNGRQATAATIHIATAVLGPVQAIDTTNQVLTVLGQPVQVNASTVFDAPMRGGLAALHVGDLVAVYALIDAAGAPDVATRIEAAPGASFYRLRGTVSALDTAGRTLQVGGATVSYANATGVPATLANGQVVSLKLAAGSSLGTLTATSFGVVAVPTDGEAAVMQGFVTTLASGTSFTVNGYPVDASHAQVVPPASAVGRGVYVSVEGRISGGTLIASSVEVPGQAALDNRSFHLAGTVSGLDTTAGAFTVRHVSVDYTSARFVNGTAASLANGANVQVDGPLSPDGTQLLATSVVIQ